MKTHILGLVSLILACSNQTFPSFGCPDDPPPEGSACDLTTFPTSDVCFGPGHTIYRCNDAGQWTYASLDCPQDPADVSCAAIAPLTFHCAYGSCSEGLTVVSCDEDGQQTVTHAPCGDGGAEE